MTKELTINYQAPGPVAYAFQQSKAFLRGIRGPFGSGKSTLCAVEILRRATEQKKAPNGIRYSRFAITRNSYPELKTTTITTWHEIVPPTAGRWVDQGPPTHHLITPEMHCEVLFLALDSPADVAKLLSMNLTGAWMNEAREQPKAILDGLTGRVGRYPPASLGGPSWQGIIMDTNPPDADHWWHTLAEEDDSTPQGRRLIDSMRKAEEELRKLKLLGKKQPLFEFFAQPGGTSPGAENASVLPPGYYQRMMAGKTDAWIKIYVHGEYGFVLDGRAVYPEYSEQLHAKAIKPIPGVGLHIGLDFGLTPAAAICQRLQNGAWRVHDEVTSEHLGATRFAEQLALRLKEKWRDYDIETITGDPAGNQPLGDDVEKTVFKVMKLAGIDAKPALTNDWTPRREAVAGKLTKIVDGESMLIIGPECHKLRKAMAGGYHYKRIQVTGDERYQDKPNKNEFSHVAEALQYAMLGAGEGDAVVRGKKRTTAMQIESDYLLLG
jgi:hypothetical protein